MATRQSFKVLDASSLTYFKEWATEISAAFAALGWVKAADTGQVDWATLAAVPVAASPVYEIWKMADALAATAPFLLKIEYGIIGTNQVQIWLTPGVGSNGSGTLTGAGVRNQLSTTAQTNGGATQYECDFSGTSSRFNCCLWRNNGIFPVGFGAERAKDNAGADTDEYVTLWQWGYQQAARQQTIPKLGSGASPGAESRFLDAYMTTILTSSYGNKIAVAPIFPFLGNYGNPLTSVVGLKKEDWADGSVFNVTMYGANRTMMAIGKTTFPGTTAVTGGMLGIRWD